MKTLQAALEGVYKGYLGQSCISVCCNHVNGVISWQTVKAQWPSVL